ncbi:LOW QUALITY PROTEIN: protein phosphatase 1 regulatory subunit 3E [Mauremys reevesii]|uniref:LOW QUALITY PROTEIN: protein phosphatase 1 regulatory subunit 3E n=1 Tax=Mauremys reevesii TaxID=260615 RepID=UPI00193EC93B|nr:LOW QUALITY PROTEIN: protein phosphatase 1 regulatory subunit 3E [Mauremys reevesii]
MARAPPPPSDIPRNLSYIAGLYGGRYRTVRPSLGGDSTRRPRGGPGRARGRQSRAGSRGGGRRARSAPAGGPGGGSRSRSPGSRKRVRFADALGLELVSVRRYWPAELPQVPERVHTQLRRDALRHFAPLRPFQVMGGAGGRGMTAAESDPQDPLAGRLPLAPCFWDPLGLPDFGGRLGAQGVCLEGVRAGGLGVAGTLRVLNLAYEKRVSVRYTWDGWASYREAPAAYAGPSAGPPPGPPSDRFAFRLPLPPGGALEFALRCHVGGQELWDNNGGQNYILRAGGRGGELPSPPRDGDRGWIHFL